MRDWIVDHGLSVILYGYIASISYIALVAIIEVIREDEVK